MNSDKISEEIKNLYGFREVRDSLGPVRVPQDALWGAQTQRSLCNFDIGNHTMPWELIRALVMVKWACAQANVDQGRLDQEDGKSIVDACNGILIIPGAKDNPYTRHFPLKVWQTGSGTHTNMNCNEVIARIASDAAHNNVHPNDHVNIGQSSNDVFPTAMYISIGCALEVLEDIVARLRSSLEAKVNKWKDIIKIGRTHLQDATPLSLGQEFSAFEAQMEHCLREIGRVKASICSSLPIGGTAVGTGLNAFKGFDELVVSYLNKGIERFWSCKRISLELTSNKFAHIAAHDVLADCSGVLNTLAVAAHKMANDVRMLGSGPRCGIGELKLPVNEPGSSIMPGKVNPTQSEALCMVCARVMGNHVSTTICCMNGHFQLNAYKPLMVHNILESIDLLCDSLDSFKRLCLDGIEANTAHIESLTKSSLMLVTPLSRAIGYELAANIAKAAYENGSTLLEEAIKQGISEEEFAKHVQIDKMIGPL